MIAQIEKRIKELTREFEEDEQKKLNPVMFSAGIRFAIRELVEEIDKTSFRAYDEWFTMKERLLKICGDTHG